MPRLSFLAVLPLAAVLLGQDPRGRIAGRLTDPSGAVIPHAVVDATHLAMNTKVEAVSNSAGNFELPFLIPGLYRVHAALAGFKQFTREPVEVRIGDTVTLNITLELGDFTQSVSITGEAPILESSSASLGQVSERKQLEALPLSGGNVLTLPMLAAGMWSNMSPGHNWLPSIGGDNVFASGTRGGSTEYSLDGIPNMTRRQIAVIPPQEAVQEVRVDTAQYDASTQRGAGAAVSMTMKAGTNEVHGALRWEVNPNPWQANSFFTNKQIYDTSSGPVTPQKIRDLSPQRKVNRYSSSISGPVFLPRLYNGRNRTFWTYSFQGFNRRNPNNTYQTVPMPAQREGDFASLLAAGPQYQIYDPATIAPAAGGRFSRQPFAGNRIPASRIQPAARAYLKFFSDPNVTGTFDGRNNYQVTAGNSNDFYQTMGRVDHVFSDRHRVFGRYAYSWLHFYSGDLFFNRVLGNDRNKRTNTAAFDDVYVISAALLLNTRFGFSRFLQSDFPFTRGYDLASLGLSRELIRGLNQAGVAFPRVTIAGQAGLGSGSNTIYITNYYTGASTLNWTRGNHSVRAGIDFRLLRENTAAYGDAAPLFDFSTNWTRGPLDNSPGSPIGQGLASLLLGLPTGGGIDLNTTRAEQSSLTALFLQDDWKITRRLTLNAGLRWEYESAPTERYDRSARGYDFSVSSPIEAAARRNYAAAPIPEVPVSAFRATGGLRFVALDGQPRGLWTTGKRNFAPRVGLAYAMGKRTVARAGYGVFLEGSGIDYNHVNQIGYSQRTTLVPSLDNGLTFRATLANPFPDGLQQPAPVGLTTYLGRGISYFPAYRPTPYLQRWNLSIQRQLGGRSLAEITYMGSRTTRSPASRQMDPIPAQYLSVSYERDQRVIDYLSAQVANPFAPLPEFAGSGLAGVRVARSALLRPFPHFTSITTPDPVGFSWYHSLQARAEKRFSKGLLFMANYTWSKMMEAIAFLNDTDPMPHHVISTLDRPQRFTVSTLYELPIGKGRPVSTGANRFAEAVFGQWQVQVIYQAQSGPPIGFGNILFRGLLSDIVLPRDERRVERWFNTDAGFERNTARQLASNIRAFPLRLTGLRSPGDSYWNMSASKVFRAGERWKAELRSDWEGAFNTPLFSPPDTSPASSAFGQITATREEPRRISVGLRVSF